MALDLSVSGKIVGTNPGQASLPVQVSGSSATGHETLTVSGVALGLASIPVGVTAALITVEESIRFWADGGVPTATEGHERTDGQVIVLESGDEVTGFRAVRIGATDATLQVSYYTS